MRILFISQFYLPERAAGTSRVHGLALEWRKSGHDVTVVTFFPHYPAGTHYSGFDYANRLFKEEEGEAGIRILRGPNLFYKPGQLGKRLLDLPFSAVSAALVATLKGRGADVVIATSPQPLLFYSAIACGKALGIPVVLDVRDHWPEAVSRGGGMLFSLGVPIARRLVAQAYAMADLVVGVSPAYDAVFRRYGVPARKRAIVENGLTEDFFPLDAPATLRIDRQWEDRFVVSFVGTMGRNMGLQSLLATADLLRGDSMEFVLVGDGAERPGLQTTIEERRLHNVHLLPAASHSEVAGYYRSSDASLVMLEDRPFNVPRVSAKLWEIMGMGVPLVLVAPKGAAHHIAVEQARGAVWVPPGNPGDLAEALRALKADPEGRSRMGSNGLRFVRGGFTRKLLAARYAQHLQDVIQRKHGS